MTKIKQQEFTIEGRKRKINLKFVLIYILLGVMAYSLGAYFHDRHCKQLMNTNYDQLTPAQIHYLTLNCAERL